MAKGKLTEDAKAYVVRALACFVDPSEIREALKKDFAAEVTLQAIEAYDPNKSAGAKLSKQWRSLFEKTRKVFIEDIDSIGLAHKAVRLRTLERMRARAEKAGNIALVVEITVEAEKIVGEIYTNKRVLTGKDGKPLFPAKPITDTMTAAEAAEAYAASRDALDG